MSIGKPPADDQVQSVVVPNAITRDWIADRTTGEPAPAPASPSARLWSTRIRSCRSCFTQAATSC
jgi:hypothetical protein